MQRKYTGLELVFLFGVSHPRRQAGVVPLSILPFDSLWIPTPVTWRKYLSRVSGEAPSLPYSFGLDRTTTRRDAVPRSSPRYLSFVPFSTTIVFALAREFFDPFYGVRSVRIICSLNYISILPRLVSLALSPRWITDQSVLFVFQALTLLSYTECISYQ